MNKLLAHIRENPVECTYFGIGTMFRVHDLQKITLELDQIFPCFLNRYEQIRGIHFDPLFKQHWNLINEYFYNKGFYKSEKDHTWISHNGKQEFILFPEELEHSVELFNGIALRCLPNKLVIQDFSGRFLNDMCIQVYYSILPQQRDLYKKKVLIDLTYGDASCMTNMKETFPIYDSDGNFINFLLIQPSELVSYINQNPKLDLLIKDVFKKEYKKILNEDHTNYRRRMQGLTCLFSCSEYHPMADPETVFCILIEKLNKCVNLLKHVGFPEEKYINLIKDYKNYDMHKWYSIMNGL
jgi:hypothetical protein